MSGSNPKVLGGVLKIAVFRSSSIGDVVLATSVLQLILRLWPKAIIYWLGSNPSLELIKKSYPGVHTLDVKASDFSYFKTASILQGADILLDLQGSIRSLIVSLLSYVFSVRK